MKFNPLKTVLIGGALGGAMIIGAITLGPAGADDKAPTTTAATSDSAHPSREHHMNKLTDAQKKCLADAGLTRPEGKPTDAQREAFHAAAKKCGITKPEGMGHGGKHRPQLTDAQKKCLTDAGFTKPATRPTTPPTEEQRAAFKAAAEKCGITLPTGMGKGHHGGRHQLTDAQKKCLTDAGITKPEGRPTAEHMTAMKAAAEKCGITMGAHGGPGGRHAMSHG